MKQCPKCGFEEALGDECPRCGVIIEKYKSRETQPAPRRFPQSDRPTETTGRTDQFQMRLPESARPATALQKKPPRSTGRLVLNDDGRRSGHSYHIGAERRVASGYIDVVGTGFFGRQRQEEIFSRFGAHPKHHPIRIETKTRSGMIG